jgi:N-methylhydantoinase B
MQTREEFDLITFEVLRNALAAAADEMALMVMRSARSSVVRELLDFAAALCDRDGRLIAQGLSLPLHLGSIPDAIQVVRQRFGDKIAPGDLIVLNDPFHGGMHLPDIFMFKPIFFEERLEGFAVVVAHHADIGGRVPGGGAADSTEIFQEGLRLPPLKLHVAGVPDEAVYDLIKLNVRVPDTVMGDLGAQVAGCMAGEHGLQALLQHYGADVFHGYIDEILNYSERVTRQEIAHWPDGDFEFTDYEDHDGRQAVLVPVKVRVEIRGDHVRFDFTGSSPQVKGAINCTPSFARSAVYIAVRSLMRTPVPNNEGCFRPIEIVLPEGSIFNPRPPAAFAARGVLGYRILDAIFGAMAKALPGQVPAAGDGGISGIRIGGYHASGRAFQFNDIICGSWGAGASGDGGEGLAHIATNISNQPIEILEAENPVRVIHYGFVPDTGGAGRHRGGLALERHLEFTGTEAVLQVRTHRRDVAPYGLEGGEDGSTSETYLWRDGKESLLETKITLPIQKGDRIRHITAGGGGFGDPLERDPAAVVNDIRKEKITRDYAARKYGVVVNAGELVVDAAATERQRAQLRAGSGQPASTTIAAS